MTVHQVEPYNAEPPRSVLVDAVTPVSAFYSRNHGPVPAADEESWRLRVDGLVTTPLSLSPADLRERFPERTETATLQCAGNRRAGLVAVKDIPGEAPWGPTATATAAWTGVRLADVLAAAGVSDTATDVEFLGADVSPQADPPQEFGGSIPLRKAGMPEVLLAWAMNGEPLPPVHGAPLRVVVPGYIGARSVKWVHRVRVTDAPSPNFFQASTYRLLPPDAEVTATPGEGVELGLVAVNSDFLTPDDDAEVPAGPTGVTGYAFAGGDRTIVRVDVSADGGSTWTQAELGEQASTWAWRHWDATVDVPHGEVELLARAWDSSAALQPERPEQVWNPKGYVNNSWARLRLRGV
ncbi:sulfite oxidase [Actinomycetospora termitidis]|uniref:Sulfite oxidase n=1 Tax=Actinomycetospora termitidis TaxID=3053470 RepID=A0ABT7MAL1_9PSEU|nr:sulfite oxidase [Actinomycetospora sp. Odt1-22]MDL5157702.1 sulfite oxidase [Actinomycetospora sp. Odt1-22]